MHRSPSFLELEHLHRCSCIGISAAACAEVELGDYLERVCMKEGEGATGVTFEYKCYIGTMVGLYIVRLLSIFITSAVQTYRDTEDAVLGPFYATSI